MEKLAEVLGVSKEKLEELEIAMQKAGFMRVLDGVAKENKELIQKSLEELSVKNEKPEEIKQALAEKVKKEEDILYSLIGVSRANFDFEKIAKAAREIATESTGFFLKKEYAKEILRQRPPEATMSYLGYTNVEEMLNKEDIGDVFSALRFTQTDEWMHETFEVAYTKFTPDDFEHRPIELRVLGPRWKEIAQKYVAKKHHNVSHLKEFGIIFLNPIAQTEPGKFLRDFALLLHYFHEVSFYSKLFERYSSMPDFNQKFISLLRGDVKEVTKSEREEWLIVQRYLWKENPRDPRLFLPRVNPEALHWRKAQKDLVEFGKRSKESGLEFWDDLDAGAGMFEGELISFDMEDNAMRVAALGDGRQENFFYHQREALWNKIFAAYGGGYDRLEQYIRENMDKGVINLQKEKVL
ncbi:MAG: hypothetical protein AAB567_03530 [Patescibacteria group bacterium]